MFTVRCIKSVVGIMLGSVLVCFILTDSALAGKKFKVGYLEAGDYWIYTETSIALRQALEEMGWKDKIEFAQDAHFSPGWDKAKDPERIERAKQLMNRKDIDLIITMGTGATKSILDANNGNTPILAMGVSDAVKSKFVASEKDSGIDNFTVRIVPGRFKRMFEIFHDVVNFKKLGLLYPDTENGRKYSNVADAKQVSAERGFKIIEYTKISTAEKPEECEVGLQWLFDQGIDAFFIPSINCFDWTKGDAKKLFDLLIKNKIPSFARNGTQDVKAGALMGFSTIDFSKRGQFLADTLVKILKGASPRSLNMIDNATPLISLNIHVAEKIGVDPSFDILGASDEIFQEITLPDDRLYSARP